MVCCIRRTSLATTEDMLTCTVALTSADCLLFGIDLRRRSAREEVDKKAMSEQLRLLSICRLRTEDFRVAHTEQNQHRICQIFAVSAYACSD